MARAHIAWLRGFAPLVCALAIGGSGRAQTQDVLGIWFDRSAGADTLATTQSPEIVTAYLLLTNATSEYGVSGWECGIEVAGDGVLPVAWELSAGVNVATPPEFQVGIGVDNRLFWAPSVLLATVRLLVASPAATGRLYIHPYAIPSLDDPPGSGHPLRAPIYAAGHDPGDLRPLQPASGDEALPVAVINPATTPLCHLSTAGLDFGRVLLGGAREELLSIANVGGGLLAGSVGAPDDPAFSVVAGGGAYALGPGEVRAVTVRCAPLAAGPLAGALAACGAVALAAEGVEQGACAVAPTALAFGDVGVARSRCLDATIGNPSAAPVGGEVVVSGTGYAVTAGGGAYQLDPGQTRVVTVCFTPPQVGAADGLLDLGVACGPLPLSGTGVILPPECALAGAPLDFGTVLVGASADRTFTLRNAGAGTLTGAIAIAGDQFALTAGAGPFALAELESLAVTVRYAPSAPGAHTAQVDLGTGLCGPVACSGGAPLCTLSADTLHFGEVTVGTQASRSLLIGNAGGGVLTGRLPRLICDAYSLPYVQPGDLYDYAVTAGAPPLELPVTFAPITAGRLVCSLPATECCAPVVLEGTGVWPPPQCALPAGDHLDFGSVPVGSVASRTFQIVNPGLAPLSGEVRLDDPVFALGEGGGPFTLPGGQSRQVVVRAAPQAPGSYSCIVQTGAPICGDVICVATSPTPVCRILTSTLTFGDVPLGASQVETLIIWNLGPGRLDGIVTSADAAFRVIGDGRYSLPQYDRTSIEVEFVPQTVGVVMYSLSSGSSCGDIACIGNGLAPGTRMVTTPADSLVFGTVAVGGQRDLSLTLRNAGGDTLSGTVTVEGAGFSIIGDPDYRLAWQQTKLLVVRFAPVVASPSAGIVRIGDDATLTCAGTGAAAQSDVIGIWFDADGLSNSRNTTAFFEPVTAWLLIRSPSQPADVASWEACVSIVGDGVQSAQWTCFGEVPGDAPPCSRVVPATPLAPAGDIVRLARVDFVQTSPGMTTLFFVQPAPHPALPGAPAYATVADPSLFLPLGVPAGSPYDPVAVVNGGADPPLPLLAPAPAVTCAPDGVRLALACDPAGGDACRVYRRVGNGQPQPLPGAPLPDGRGGALYTDPTAPPDATLLYSYALLRDGTEIARSAETAATCAGQTPTATTLHPVFPNPFNPLATVRFDLARPGRATVTVFDLAGRRVRTLCDADLPAGPHARTWDGRDDAGQPAPSGTYYARLAADGVSVMHKMALIR